MKNQKGIVWAPLLIIIGAVVVAGFVTYFLIQNNNGDAPKNTNAAVVNQTNSNVNNNSNTNSATHTNQALKNNASVNTNTSENTNTNTATDATTGWKTYTSSTDGYAFKYPTDWKIEIATPTSGGIPADYVSAYGDDGRFVVCPRNDSHGCVPFQDGGDTHTTKNITVAGKPAVETLVTSLVDHTTKAGIVFHPAIAHWSDQVNFLLSHVADDSTEQRILSTFQFTN